MIALYLWLGLGCSSKKFPTTTIKVGDQAVVVELAVNEEQRAQGLMHRASMPHDEGMLFVYPSEKPRSFWMKDTKLPLSIAYIDSSGKIVKISKMQPLSRQSVKSIYPAKYALEMNQGWFDEKGFKKGVMVTDLPDDKQIGVE